MIRSFTRTLLPAILLFALAGNASARDSIRLDGPGAYPSPSPSGGEDAIYQKGKLFVDAGIQFGFYNNYYYGNNWNSLTPLIPVTANLEIAVWDFIGVGGYLGYGRQSFEYSHRDFDGSRGWHTDRYERSYTYTSFGVKGQFHVIPFLDQTFDFDHNLDGSKYDLYIAHYLGLRITRDKWEDDVDDDVEDDVNVDTDVGVTFLNPTVGARYMFTDFFGAYAEVGYGHWGGSDLTAGLTLRF